MLEVRISKSEVLNFNKKIKKKRKMRLTVIHTSGQPNQKGFGLSLCDENQFVREKTLFR